MSCFAPTRLRVVAAMGLLPLSLASADALGQGAKSTTTPRASSPIASAAPTPPAPASAIAYVAAEIARGLERERQGMLVAVSPLVSDVPAPRSDELAMRIASHVAGRMHAARAHPQPVSLPAARAAARRATALVYVELEIKKGELRATADLFPIVSNAWERLRDPAPGPRAHAFVAAPIDAEVRTFLSPIVLEKATVHKVQHEETDVLAIGCGDIDEDGGLELALATRDRVVVGKLRAGKLEVVRAVPWARLAARAPVPLREPIASVVFPARSRGQLLIGTTDRGAVAVDAALVPRRRLTGVPVPGAGGDACLVADPGSGAFDGAAIACAPPPKGAPPIVFASPAPRLDAIAMLDLVGIGGAVDQVLAVREPTGKVHLRQSGAHAKAFEATLEAAGAELTLGDLDLDGIAEVVFSSDADDDALTIASFRSNGLIERMKLPAKEGVHAVAVCPPEERGLPALVAVVGSEVWLVR